MTPSDQKPLELVIVGAGPVGLYAAHYAGYRSLRFRVLESMPMVGGQIAAFYPDELLYDIPGFPKISGDELVTRLEAQARKFAVEIQLQTHVDQLERVGNGIRVHYTNERSESESIDVAAALLTTGIGKFAPQEIQDPNIAAWKDRGLSYQLDLPQESQSQRVLVIGGTGRAVELALAHQRAGSTTTLIHRRDRLRIPPELRAELDASGVDFQPFLELVAIEGTDRVETAVLFDRRDKNHTRLRADRILPCFGFAANNDSLASLGASTSEGRIPVDSRMWAAPSIWAAGDVATYRGKVRVLATEFGEACTAVNNIAAELIPKAPLFPGYSSHRPEPRPRRD